MSEVGKRQLQYLYHALQLNPVTQASAIIRRRSRCLGLDNRSVENPSNQDTTAIRANLRKRIDTLRNQFWTMHGARIRQELESMPVEEFPELKMSVNRLRTMTTYRDEFQKLAAHPKKNINLLNTFKRVVMSPPVQAGQIKEKYLRNMAMDPNAERVKLMAKVIRKEFPQLYELESDWFNEIIRLKPRRIEKESYGGGGSDFEVPGWLIVLAVLFFIRVIILILRSMSS